MLRNRIIPFLLVRDHGLVKTQRYEKPVYVGDPINAIRIFNEKEVDELALLDIGATSAGRGPNYRLVEDVASECFMPLAYGGGIRRSQDAEQLFALGVEKVIVRAAALEDLSIVSSIASMAGSQSVAVSVDVRRHRGRRRLYAPRLARHDDPAWLGFLKAAVEAGAGEIVLNAVDRDGTMSGIDAELIAEAAAVCSAPLVAVGGVGSLPDIRAAIDAGADAVGAGAFFVFHGPRRAVLITYPSYDALDSLLKGRT